MTVVVVSCQMLQACEFAGDWERATRWRTVAEEFVEAQGCPYLYTECRTIHGSVLVASGEWAEAERELTTAARMTASIYPLVYAEAVAQLASLRVRQGRLDEAESLLASVEDPAYAAVPSAVLHLARGNAAAARAMLKRCLRHLTPESLLAARGLGLLVQATLLLENLAEARECLSRLQAMSNAELSPEVAAQAELAAGRVAVHAGDAAAAMPHLEAAASAFARLSMPFETACARLELARALGVEEPDLSISEGQSALAAFEKLGARDHVDMTSALLRTLGVAARPGPRGTGVLTQREQEVLDLIGAGLSNPEIAQRLYISRKTAAHHVSAILDKLSLRNRAEAAAYATRTSH
jgi:DNA-binding NarL/FixJ family response regulator